MSPRSPRPGLSCVLVLLAVGAAHGQASQSASAPATQPTAAPRELSPVARQLVDGALAEVERGLRQRLAAPGRDDEVRLALGCTELLRSVERLGQALYSYGFISPNAADLLLGFGPRLGLPVPPNPKPREISYDELRGIAQRFSDDLAAVDATLGEIRDPGVKLPLPIGLVRLDLDGDGQASEAESLWRVYASVVGNWRLGEQDARRFVIVLDRADVEWLRGYGCLLRGIIECWLAYDTREQFERTAQLLFARPQSPYPFLRTERSDADSFWRSGFLDLIAMIHLTHWPVKEGQRLQRAHEHFKAMLAHSREMWAQVLSETDDDGEWIPSPRQHAAIPGIRVTQEMVDTWMAFLSEAEALLDGRKLVPFWRADPRGVNLRRVFFEPRTFDLVLWVQGSAAAPYLEEGEKTSPATWAQFQRAFGGEFFLFAVWFN